MSENKHERRVWSTIDEDELEELWCNSTFSLNTLERKLDRSKESIKLKASRMGLGPRNVRSDLLSIAEVSKEMQVSKDRVYRWIKLGLKTKKVLAGRANNMVDVSDLLSFLEANKKLYDASIINKQLFIKEPKWLKEKRKLDRSSSSREYKYYREWDNTEDKYLISLVKKGLTYKEIGDKIDRTAIAIENRVGILQIGYMNAMFWSGQEIKYLRENSKYMTVKEISLVLDRTEKAIEWKCRDLNLEYHLSKDKCKRVT